MKRQHPWQDDSARVSVSLDSSETASEGCSTSQAAFPSRKKDDLNAQDDLGTAKGLLCGEGQEGKQRAHRESQAPGLDNEVSSLQDLPDKQRPPSAPTPPADSFLKRLGSLFHFFSKVETRVPPAPPAPPEPDSSEPPLPPLSSPPSSGSAAAEPCGADGSQQASEVLAGESERGQGDKDGHRMDKAPANHEHSHLMTQEGVPVEPLTPAAPTPDSLFGEADHSPGMAPQDQATYSPLRSDISITLDAPAVITHSAYRGYREARKMRWRQPLQVCSPVSEGDETLASRGSVSAEETRSPEPRSALEKLDSPPTVSSPFDQLTQQNIGSTGKPRATGLEPTMSQYHLSEVPSAVRSCHEDKDLSDLQSAHTQENKIAVLYLDRCDGGGGVQGDVELTHLLQEDDGVQCESKVMVDVILRNALTALQKIETSARDTDIHHEDRSIEAPQIFIGASHVNDGEDYHFKDCSIDPLDKQVMPTHLDDQNSLGRAQREGSRSTFSSGYESIAGSDTDIQSSPAQSFEGSPLATSTSSRQLESGVTDSYREKLAGDSECENTDGELCSSEVVDVVGNTMSDVEDSESVDVVDNVMFECEDRKTEGGLDMTDVKLKDLRIETFVLCNESEPGDDNVNKDTRPKFSQMSLQSVEIQPISHCTIQTETVDSKECKLKESQAERIIEVPNTDRESSGSTKTYEELNQGLVVRPKSPQLSEPILESHSIEGNIGAVQPPLNDCDPQAEWSTVVAHQCTISDQFQDSNMCDSIAASHVKDRFVTFKGPIPDSGVDGGLLARPISSTFAGPQPPLYSGFPLTAEEQEEVEDVDSIFVNDTGSTEKPAARRGKMYRFSLSPIFEEEESLQVPPATEESLKSGEQQACSILSLLQSVSDRLQSSAFSDSDPDICVESLEDSPWQQWARFSDRESVDEHESSVEELLLPSSDLTTKEDVETLSGLEKISREFHETSQEKDWVAILSKPKKTASSPYYDYLRSKPSLLPQAESRSDGMTSEVLTQEDKLANGRIIPRPSVMHVYEGLTFSGEKHVILNDTADLAGVSLKNGLSIRVLAGCWLLFLESGFKGSCVVLEEGEKVLNWGQTHAKPLGLAASPPDQVSARAVVKSDEIPELICYLEGKEPLALQSKAENLEAVQISNLDVKSGCWLAYELSGFNGEFVVLEPRGKATMGSGSWVTHARSLYPLSRGGPKVSRPLDPKMVVFELPGFRGRSIELTTNMPKLEEEAFQNISSLRVISGIWVGYNKEQYRGQQCLLEEGEYEDTKELCVAADTLLSFRLVLSACIEPAISLRNSHSPNSSHVDLVDLEVPDLKKEGSHMAPGTIVVKSGVWVAYSGKFFTGDQYVLEKGLYAGNLDWGEHHKEALSIRPVRLSGRSREPNHLIRAYREPNFQGRQVEFELEEADCSNLHLSSFRVIHGRWVLFDGEGCSGSQFVLTEGLYPDLASCGNVTSAIKSLRPVPYCFSDPSVSLFSLDSFEGLETEAVTTTDSMGDFCTQSVRVNSGQWLAYEYSNFKGGQMLLEKGEYATWTELSGWNTIGSLQALGEPKVYIQLRNRELGSALTVDCTWDKDSPAKVFLKAPESLDSQRWVFTEGLLKSKIGKACLSVIGGKAHAGARVAMWREHGRTHQRWSLNDDGTISSHLNKTLVLDIRGGPGPDRDYFIIDEFSADRPTQYWEIGLV